jgi:hypothetical protein
LLLIIPSIAIFLSKSYIFSEHRHPWDFRTLKTTSWGGILDKQLVMRYFLLNNHQSVANNSYQYSAWGRYPLVLWSRLQLGPHPPVIQLLLLFGSWIRCPIWLMHDSARVFSAL